MDVSIPFIAGQWSLPHDGNLDRSDRGDVSIPFIAGQWSLLEPERATRINNQMFQSPSLRGSGRFRPPSSPHGGKRRRFNPLHCGAVVASDEAARDQLRKKIVSIPFIAGQWSLRVRGASGRMTTSCFNPLHCGAVVASTPKTKKGRKVGGFQSPSLRGSGRFGDAQRLRGELAAFQSPSLRGSGRFGRLPNGI